MSSPEIHKKHPRPTAEGIAVGVAISQIHLLPPAQIALTAAIHESLAHVPSGVMGEAAVGVFAAALLVNYLYEVETLKRLGFSANFVTTLAYMEIDNPYLAAAVGNVLGQLFYLINPVDMGHTLASFAHQDGGHLLFSNLISRSVLGTAFISGFNLALRQGHADKLIAKIHEARWLISEVIDSHLDRFGVYALDEAIFPPQPIDYPDNTSGDFHNQNLLSTRA